MPVYHHCWNLESVVFGEVRPNPALSDQDLRPAYEWLEKQVGFYPLFLAVGTTKYDIWMTDYQANWRRKICGWYEDGKFRYEHRKKGEFPNKVLFSFENVEGVFMDFTNWHIVLNSSYKNYQMTDYEKRLVFKPSWQKSRWLRMTLKEHKPVQLVAAKLYLPDAERIWVRNRQTKEKLESMGFGHVEVRRIKCPSWF